MLLKLFNNKFSKVELSAQILMRKRQLIDVTALSF